MRHRPHSNPNLRWLENEARTLFHALRRGDAAAIRRFYSTDPLAGAQEPRLSEAQYVIARERGYASWRQLVGGGFNRELQIVRVKQAACL
jgi:hypothetical protein